MPLPALFFDDRSRDKGLGHFSSGVQMLSHHRYGPLSNTRSHWEEAYKDGADQESESTSVHANKRGSFYEIINFLEEHDGRFSNVVR